MSFKKTRSKTDFYDVQKTIRLTDTMIDTLNERKKDTGVPVSVQIRRALEQALAEPETFPMVPVYGYIPASPASVVVYLPPGTTVRPPFRLGPDCYGLMVVGDSMEQDRGISIPDGSYAFFCPDIVPPYGGIVHVEFPRPDGEHDVTLKRYCPHNDGKTVSFEPLNEKHKTIEKRDGEYVIKGVFSRSWRGDGNGEAV